MIALGPPLVSRQCSSRSRSSSAQYGLLLFVLVFAYALFVLPKVRERAAKDVRESTRSWDLTPSDAREPHRGRTQRRAASERGR